MQVNPYLHFNGNCETAFKLYAELLGGKIEAMLPHEGTPAEAHIQAEWGKKILHACMRIGNTLVMGSDMPPNYYQQPQGFSVTLETTTPEEAERVFQDLAKGGEARMPIQQTFFAVRYGALVDQFGVPWTIYCPASVVTKDNAREPQAVGVAPH